MQDITSRQTDGILGIVGAIVVLICARADPRFSTGVAIAVLLGIGVLQLSRGK